MALRRPKGRDSGHPGAPSDAESGRLGRVEHRFWRSCRHCSQERSHSDEVVGGGRESEDPIDAVDSAVAELPQEAHGLPPAEAFSDFLSVPLTYTVTWMSRRSAVDRTASATDVPGHVRRDPEPSVAGHELAGIVELVGSEGPASGGWALPLQHRESRFDFSSAGGVPHLSIDEESIAVLHQDTGHVAEFGFLALLSSQARIRIGRGGVGFIAPLLPSEINFIVAPDPALGRLFILGPAALLRSPGFQQSAIDGEVIGREQMASARLLDHAVEEGNRDVSGQESLAVLAEGGRRPHRIIGVQADEPVEEQIVVELLHELTLAANGEKHLNQQRPQHLLGRN